MRGGPPRGPPPKKGGGCNRQPTACHERQMGRKAPLTGINALSIFGGPGLVCKMEKGGKIRKGGGQPELWGGEDYG